MVATTTIAESREDIPAYADFVIVGGGAAGCVLASRLCRDLPKASIVLLERGAPRTPEQDFVTQAVRLDAEVYRGNLSDTSKTLYDVFSTEPDANLYYSNGVSGRTLPLVDAATLGGASNLAYQYSVPLDGTVESWGINGLYTPVANAYYQRVQDTVRPVQPARHTQQDYTQEAVDAFVSNGFVLNQEAPGKGSTGARDPTVQVNYLFADEQGRRKTAVDLYLQHALHSCPNLLLVQDATAVKLLPSFLNDDNTIDTVSYVSTSNPQLANPWSITATEQVILTSGPYGSPKLLQLSGIGSADTLRQLGIDNIVADLPVGQETRLRLSVGSVAKYSGVPEDGVNDPSRLTPANQEQFQAGKGGPYGVGTSCTHGRFDYSGYHSSTFLSVYQTQTFSAMCEINSQSTGNLTISSKDPFAMPRVHSNFFHDVGDMLVATRCVASMRDVVNSLPPNFHVEELGPANWALNEWIVGSAATNFHFIGGNAVGRVVDGDLKVMGGIQKLRVVDASVFPSFPLSAGTLSSVYMLAEFMADKMQIEYGNKYAGNSAEVVPIAMAFLFAGLSTLFSLWLVLLSLKNVVCARKGKAEQGPFIRSSWLPKKRRSWVAGSSLELSCRNRCAEDTEDDLSDAMTHFSEETNRPLISWSHLSCSYKGSGKSKTSLKNSYGEAKAGELTAILGSSGSGKSTLLDILAGRKTLGILTGQVSVLGEFYKDIQGLAANPDGVLRAATAYVPQQETFFPMQTAEEAVAFAANMKLGKEPRGDDVRKRNIRALLLDVGLSPECFSRPIGGTVAGGFVIRGLSGGERKRLALACALALKPRILFLDEITSGLDSENATAVTHFLKRLCVIEKVAAIMVVHQPGGRLFQEFDRVVLLQQGATVFSGAASALSTLYEDVFEDTMPEWYDLPTDVLHRTTDLPDDKLHKMSSRSQPVQETLAETDDEKAARSLKTTTLWKFSVIFWRNLINHYCRNYTNLACRLALICMVAFIDGLLFWDVGNLEGVSGLELQRRLHSVTGALTFIVLGYSLLPFCMIPIFTCDKTFYLGETALGLYSPWLYCIVQLILEAWVVALTSASAAAIMTPMCALWNPTLEHWETFFTLIGALTVSGLAGTSMVMMFSMMLPSQDLAFLASSGLATASLAVSGGFVPFPDMHNFVAWMQWGSPCKYTLQSMALSIFRGSFYEDLLNEMFAFNTPPSVSENTAVLLLFYVVFACGTVIALSRQREVR